MPRTRRFRGIALPVVAAAAAALTLTAAGAVVANADSRQLQSTTRQAALAISTMAATAGRDTPAPVVERRSRAVVDPEVAWERAAERASRAKARLEQQARVAAKAAAAKAAARAAAKAKAAAAQAAARRWVLPIQGYRLSSPYGFRWGRLHAGVDFARPTGGRLVAMSSGTVVYAGYSGGYGNKVEIRYWDGTVSYYAHMDSITVRKGERVTPGQLVGRSGNTGRSTGPHLHLEIHPGGGAAVNPVPWLRAHGLRA